MTVLCTGEKKATQSKGTPKYVVVVVAPSDVVAPSHAATPTRIATATPTDDAVADTIDIEIEIEKKQLLGVWEEDDKEAVKQQNMDIKLCNRFYL